MIKYIFFLSFILLCVSGHASTITVTNTDDAGSGSLRDAISNAVSGDTIDFSVTGTILFESTISWNKSLTIKGSGRNDLVLDGDGLYRIFTIDGGTNRIQDMSFTNGGGINIGACVRGPWSGGAADSTIVSNCNFSNSSVTDSGAAISCTKYLSVNNCFIDNCISTGNLGGGVVASGGSLIENTTFTNCSAPGIGGAMWIVYGGHVIRSCTFANNQSSYKGGAVCFSGPGDVDLINNTFSNNTAQNGGNSIFSEGYDQWSLTTLTLQNNIFSSVGNNYDEDYSSSHISNGGNICSDASMNTYLDQATDLNSTNPQLNILGLQNNGGDLPTISIDCNSPAYNSGIVSGSPLLDQIGQARYLNVDIGAFEYQLAVIMDTFNICSGESFTFYDGTTVNNLTASATHVSYYTSMDGCDSLRSTTVNIFDLPEISFSITDVSCGEDNGEVDATLTGNGPFTTSWSNGESTEDIEELIVNSYYLTVTDANNCEAVGVATVSSNEITITSTITDVPCVGLTSGAIDLAVTGTATPFTYQWTNGSTNQDISNLPAGQYEVIVTDANDCESSMSFNVEQPEVFEADIDVTNAGCGLTDGSVDLTITGGTPNLSFDWTNSLGNQIATTEDLTSMGQGVYSLTVTDVNGCSFETTAQVSEQGAPIISLVDVVNAGCSNDGEIDIDIISANATTVLWSNTESTEDITGLAVGTYFVNVEDDVTGCVSNLVVEVEPDLPIPVDVCLVSVDQTTGTNLVVWEKPVSTTIDKFIIYRETAVAGQYLVVDSVDYADESQFTDPTAFPHLRSWRYKISVLNNCGIESDLSLSHKTIHIGISPALGGGYNLYWDDYEGFTYLTFDVWRHTDVAGWELIQSMSTSNFSYFDNPSSTAGLQYYISVSPPSICQSTKAQDHNTSRSNTSSVNMDVDGTDGVAENGASSVLISPNPSTDLFFVSSKLASGYQVSIYDMNGRLVKSFSGAESNFTVDLSDFENGMYILEFKTDSAVIRKELVKQ